MCIPDLVIIKYFGNNTIEIKTIVFPYPDLLPSALVVELQLIHVLSKEKTNLMPIILLFIQYSFSAQHVSAVNTTIFMSLRLTGCYFMGGICKKYRGIVLACYLLGRCWS